MGPERRPALHQTQLVDPNRQVAGCGRRRIFLADGSGGGVAGIGKHRLALLQLAPIELVESPIRHVDLAPDLHNRRRRFAE